MSKLGESGVELRFGDVIQLGDQTRDSGQVAWFDNLNVVSGPNAANLTNCVIAWPIITVPGREPYIDMGATVSGTHVRRCDNLSVEEVSVLLRRGWEGSRLATAKGVESIIQNYVENQPQPPRRYEFMLDDMTIPSFPDLVSLLEQIRAIKAQS